MRNPFDVLRSRQQEYMSLARWIVSKVGASEGEIAPGRLNALADLARFCRWGTTCFDPDARIHAHLEGRRETFQRILDILQLTPTQQAVLFRARFDEESKNG